MSIHLRHDGAFPSLCSASNWDGIVTRHEQLPEKNLRRRQRHLLIYHAIVCTAKPGPLTLTWECLCLISPYRRRCLVASAHVFVYCRSKEVDFVAAVPSEVRHARLRDQHTDGQVTFVTRDQLFCYRLIERGSQSLNCRFGLLRPSSPALLCLDVSLGVAGLPRRFDCSCVCAGSHYSFIHQPLPAPQSRCQLPTSSIREHLPVRCLKKNLCCDKGHPQVCSCMPTGLKSV